MFRDFSKHGVFQEQICQKSSSYPVLCRSDDITEGSIHSSEDTLCTFVCTSFVEIKVVFHCEVFSTFQNFIMAHAC